MSNLNWEEIIKSFEDILGDYVDDYSWWNLTELEKERMLSKFLSQSRSQTIEEIKGKIEKDFMKWFNNSSGKVIEDWMEDELNSLK